MSKNKFNKKMQNKKKNTSLSWRIQWQNRNSKDSFNRRFDLTKERSFEITSQRNKKGKEWKSEDILQNLWRHHQNKLSPLQKSQTGKRTRAESIFKVIMKLPKWEKHGYPDSWGPEEHKRIELKKCWTKKHYNCQQVKMKRCYLTVKS